MPESGPFGSVRGVRRKAHPYRDIEHFCALFAFADLVAVSG